MTYLTGVQKRQRCNLVQARISNDLKRYLKMHYPLGHFLNINIWKDNGRVIAAAVITVSIILRCKARYNACIPLISSLTARVLPALVSGWHSA
jgi:hypothetical protein